MSVEKGIKFDDNKVRFSLVPWSGLKEIVKVLQCGSAKYADNNWKIVSGAKERYKEALLRHVIADAEGELVDQDYGLLHLAHAGCCILFLIWFYIKDNLFSPFTPDYQAIKERYKEQRAKALSDAK